MTPEQELEYLIADQAADDTHYVPTPGWQVSLDAPAPSGEGGTIGAELIGRDPWPLVDDVIDLGLDPEAVAYSGDLIDGMPARRGLGGGLADPRAIPHGTPNGYTNYKCKCSRCRGAWAEYLRAYRAAKAERAA